MNSKIQNLSLIVATAVIISVLGAGSAVAGKLITGKNIKNSSITSSDIKNNSLQGSDIKNGSVRNADLHADAKAALQGPKGDTGDHGPLASAQNPNNATTDSTTMVDANNLVTTIDVPTGATKLLVDFSAECSITHATESRVLYAQIVVDGNVTTVGNQALCRNIDSDPAYQLYVGASMQRVVEVAPGSHEVKVQFRASGADATARLDEGVLTVQTGR